MGKYFPHKGGNYSPSESRNCAYCGKEIKVKGKNQRSQKNSYCNRDCMSKAYVGKKPSNFIGGPQTVKCAQCGKEAIRTYTEAHIRKNHFCSDTCEGVWKSQNTGGAYFSSYKGGYKKASGKGWEAKKRLCRERDNNTCRICGMTSNEHGGNMIVEHRITREAFGTDYKSADDLSNLWCLCRYCHANKTNWELQFGKIKVDEWKPLIDMKYPILAKVEDFSKPII